MKRKLKFNIPVHYLLFVLAILIAAAGCKSFIQVDPPITTVNAGNAFKNDGTAIGVLTGLYTNLSNDNLNNLSGVSAMTIYAGLSADELAVFNTSIGQDILGYYTNNLRPNIIGNSFYAKCYEYIFGMNTAIIGLSDAQLLTPSVRQQLLGEAYFMRAFLYFNIVNLYGGVPLITTTDYTMNSRLPRATEGQIYEQIKSDLIRAKELLSVDYLTGSLASSPAAERVRPTKAAARALLARVYLYTKEWANAIAESSAVIEDQTRFDAKIPLNEVFLKNSKEVIWSLQSTGVENSSNTGEGKLFILTSSGPDFFRPYYLSEYQINAFEKGDQRYAAWTDSVEAQSIVFHYAYKYKVPEVVAASSEYSVVLRVSEQYLIRAEAQIEQGNIAEGIADLNVLRERATDYSAPAIDQLKQLSTNLSSEAAIKAVLHERQVELFTEWGHRWLDLKRTNTVDQVMKTVTPTKGGTWDNYKALFPIPQREVDANNNLKQNAGY